SALKDLQTGLTRKGLARCDNAMRCIDSIAGGVLDNRTQSDSKGQARHRCKDYGCEKQYSRPGENPLCLHLSGRSWCERPRAAGVMLAPSIFPMAAIIAS